VPALPALEPALPGQPGWARVLPPFVPLPDAVRVDLFKALDGILPKAAGGRGWDVRA
jgi:hypothetical protein